MSLIKQDKHVRTKPMRILVLGISRTGTTSLRIALEKLGYTVYHMHENIKNPKRFFPLWIEALKAKFDSEGQPYGREEFDKLLGEYDAVSDLPAALFFEELLSAYPDAQVILTLRDPEKWIASMQSTIYLAHSWSSWDTLAPYDTFARLWRECDGRDWDAFLGEKYPGRRDFLSPEYAELAKKRFNEHNERIRQIVPRQKLLEHRPQDGWGPLCEFLGHPVPKEDYPRTWDAKALVRGATMLWYIGVIKMALKTVLPVGVAVGAGVYWYSRWSLN